MSATALRNLVLAAAALLAGAAAFAQDEPETPPVAPPEASPSAIEIRVRVADVDRKPIAGAALRVLDGAKEIAAAATDESGSAVLQGLPPKPVRLTVAAKGRFGADGTLFPHQVRQHFDPEQGPVAFAGRWRPVPGTNSSPPSVWIALATLVDVRVEGARKGSRVTARVVSGEFELRLMEGVAIHMQSSGDERLLASMEAVADDEGACVLHGVPANTTLVARAEVPEFIGRAVALDVGDADARRPALRIPEAEPAWTLRGVVLGADGKPAPGARVHVAPESAPKALADPSRPPESDARSGGDVPLAWTATAGADGAWSVPHLERGKTYAARAATDDGLQSAVTWGLGAPDGNAGATAGLTVAPLAPLAGRLRDKKGVVPSRGAVTLTAVPRDDGVEREAQVADGEFAFDGVLPGRYRIVARGEGFLPKLGEIEIGPKGDENLVVVVDSGAVITGTVVDMDGKAVAQAWVQAFDPAVEATQVIRNPFGEQGTHSAADGTFRIGGLSAKRWHVRAVAEGFAPILVPCDAPAPGVTLKMGPHPRLRFGVKRPEGVSMGDVKLGVFKLVGDGTPYRAGGWDREAITEDRAAFKDLPADEEVIVRFVVPGHPPFMLRLRLEPGEVRDLGVLEPPEPHELAGVVKDSAGAPMPGIEVRADGSGSEDVTTDAEGRFKLTGIAPGEQCVSMSRWDGFRASGEATVTVPSKAPVELVLLRHCEVSGKVSDASGAGVAAKIDFHAVRPWGRLRRPESAASNADGSFAIELAPGKYRAVVFTSASDRGAAVHEIEVKETQDAPVELRVDTRR